MSEQRVTLDQPETYGAVDTQGMARHLAMMPEQVRAAWHRTRYVDLPDKHADIFSFIIIGNGGAALAGDLLRGLVAHTAQIPVVVVRGYDVPAFVGPDSIAIAVSHSGNTEETVAAFEEAIDRGVKPVIVTTGGTLESLATIHRAPLVSYTAEEAPRDALAAIFTALIAIAHAVHVVGDLAADMDEAIALLEAQRDACGPDVPTERNPAKQLARALVERIPAIYGGTMLEPVARAWKAKLNGYAKTTAMFDLLPEVNHTSTVGYAFPARLAEQLVVVQLRSSYDHPRVRTHWQVTTDVLDRRGIPQHIVEAKGRSRLAQMLWTLAFADWVAYYLALLNGVDPTAEDAIAYMKRKLAGG
ncbi:MAG: bifunctional phosphoglucose/phosphomannose isomerase [Thermomicrobia bacterium]|nr:bifunctional phosphoglucose/phosphomannose isomerase [Thermomicrobia bacterium]